MHKPLRQTIAERLGTTGHWMRSFQSTKTVIGKMVDDGEVFRFAPRDGRGRNMIALTQAGVDKYLGPNREALMVTWPQPAQRPRAKRATQRRKELSQLLEAGWSLSAIARRWGVSQQAVSQLKQRIESGG